MSYQSKLANPDVDFLFEMVLSLHNAEECYRFFEDLCTIKELRDMAQRLRVAKMLDSKMSYQIITSEINASSATIGRVKKSLIYGADGYKTVFSRIKKQ
jgi:TrpR-related protein YerC/YecD